MKSILFSLIIFPFFCFSENEFHKGEEKAKNDIILKIDNEISELNKLFSYHIKKTKKNKLKEKYKNIETERYLTAQIETYNRLKTFLLDEDKKDESK